MMFGKVGLVDVVHGPRKIRNAAERTAKPEVGTGSDSQALQGSVPKSPEPQRLPGRRVPPNGDDPWRGFAGCLGAARPISLFINVREESGLSPSQSALSLRDEFGDEGLNGSDTEQVELESDNLSILSLESCSERLSLSISSVHSEDLKIHDCEPLLQASTSLPDMRLMSAVSEAPELEEQKKNQKPARNRKANPGQEERIHNPQEIKSQEKTCSLDERHKVHPEEERDESPKSEKSQLHEELKLEKPLPHEKSQPESSLPHEKLQSERLQVHEESLPEDPQCHDASQSRSHDKSLRDCRRQNSQKSRRKKGESVWDHKEIHDNKEFSDHKVLPDPREPVDRELTEDKELVDHKVSINDKSLVDCKALSENEVFASYKVFTDTKLFIDHEEYRDGQTQEKKKASRVPEEDKHLGDPEGRGNNSREKGNEAQDAPGEKQQGEKEYDVGHEADASLTHSPDESPCYLIPSLPSPKISLCSLLSDPLPEVEDRQDGEIQDTSSPTFKPISESLGLEEVSPLLGKAALEDLNSMEGVEEPKIEDLVESADVGITGLSESMGELRLDNVTLEKKLEVPSRALQSPQFKTPSEESPRDPLNKMQDVPYLDDGFSDLGSQIRRSVHSIRHSCLQEKKPLGESDFAGPHSILRGQMPSSQEICVSLSQTNPEQYLLGVQRLLQGQLAFSPTQQAQAVKAITEAYERLKCKGQWQNIGRGELLNTIMVILENLLLVEKCNREAYCKTVLKVIRKLASSGYADAQYQLACLYISGVSVPSGRTLLKPDYVRAFNLHMSAAKRNHSEALFHVGLCYEQGVGVQKGRLRALVNYKRAAALNHPGAMFRLGMCLLCGELRQSKRPRDGVKWLKLAAKYSTEKYPQALYHLALLHDKGLPNVVWTDHAYLLQLLLRAAALNHVQSQYLLGETYEYGNFGAEPDPRKSVYYYSLAAANGSREAMFELGGWYFTGVNDSKTNFYFPQSDTKALEWVKFSAMASLPRGMYALGYFYELGIGCDTDLEKCKYWYMAAAKGGDPRAQESIKDPMERRITREGVPMSEIRDSLFSRRYTRISDISAKSSSANENEGRQTDSSSEQVEKCGLETLTNRSSTTKRASVFQMFTPPQNAGSPPGQELSDDSSLKKQDYSSDMSRSSVMALGAKKLSSNNRFAMISPKSDNRSAESSTTKVNGDQIFLAEGDSKECKATSQKTDEKIPERRSFGRRGVRRCEAGGKKNQPCIVS